MGHNLHLWHSGSDDDNDGKQDDEYGDISCAMSASSTWRSINAVHRFVHNWVNTSAINRIHDTECSSSITDVKLRSLHHTPSEGRTSLLVVPRAEGGDYVISLRTSVGYDSEIQARWKDKVSVHYTYQSSIETTFLTKNSQFLTTLSRGGVYEHGAGDTYIRISVSAIGTDDATVSVSFCEENVVVPTPPPPAAGCDFLLAEYPTLWKKSDTVRVLFLETPGHC